MIQGGGVAAVLAALKRGYGLRVGAAVAAAGPVDAAAVAAAGAGAVAAARAATAGTLAKVGLLLLVC